MDPKTREKYIEQLADADGVQIKLDLHIKADYDGISVYPHEDGVEGRDDFEYEVAGSDAVFTKDDIGEYIERLLQEKAKEGIRKYKALFDEIESKCSSIEFQAIIEETFG